MTITLAQRVKKVLSDNKALDMVEMDVSTLTTSFDTMIICTATSTRHAKSLSKKLLDALQKANIQPLGVEGEKFGEWILIDLSDVIIHIMLQPQRELYHLEKLWVVTERLHHTRRQKS